MIILIIILAAALALLWGLLNYLVRQSKHPSGFVGQLMMKIWNKAYLPMTKWSLSLLPNRSYQTILDIGVGNGASTAYLQRLFPNSQVRGIDISKDAIAQAQQHYGQDRLTFEVMDVGQMSYPDQTFDLVCAFQTHFHWPDLRQSLLEIKRVLADDGRLIIACEQSKIKYYLPNLKEREDFANYLDKIGLQLQDYHKQAGWLCYVIAKKYNGL